MIDWIIEHVKSMVMNNLWLLAFVAIILRFTPPLRRFLARKHKKTQASAEKSEESWDKQLTFVVAVIGCWVALQSYIDAGSAVRDNTNQARKAAAFEFVRDLNHDNWGEYNRWRYMVITNGWDPNTICRKIQSDDGIKQADVLLILADFDISSTAVESKQADEDITYFLLRNSMLWTYSNLDMYVSEQRFHQGKTFRGTNYLAEFYSLALAWGQQKSIVDNNKAYFVDNHPVYSFVDWRDKDNKK